MARRWVVNASPLIIFGKLGHIHLLHELCDELVIPSGVADEVDKGPETDPARLWVRLEGREYVRDVERIRPFISDWGLGSGESEKY